jgi:hypothetical protein
VFDYSKPHGQGTHFTPRTPGTRISPVYGPTSRARPTVFASRLALRWRIKLMILSAFGRDAEAQAAHDEAAAMRGNA